MSDPLDILTSRGVTPEVREARGYRRYESAADVLAADPRMGSTTPIGWRRNGRPRTLSGWTKHYGSRPGWLMPKYKLPGSAFDDPLPQLRPDDPFPGETKRHDHAWAFYGRPIARRLHEHGKAHTEHPGLPLRGRHPHTPEAKYVIAPGPHAKRWDANPLCDDRWASAERVFLHLEGCIKADALVGLGEAAADVPSVTLWDRGDKLSWADWPGDKPVMREVKPKSANKAETLAKIKALESSPYAPEAAVARAMYERLKAKRVDFWTEYEAMLPELEAARAEYQAEMDAVEEGQREELLRFLRQYVKAPVIVVCDSDWHWNPAVTVESFCLRDLVRTTGLPCVVAAPPSADDGTKQGTDDFIARGGTADGHLVIEPVESPEFATWARDYERRQRFNRNPKGDRIAQDIELLRWYSTHAIAEHQIERRPGSIGRRFGIGSESVRRATLRLKDDGALQIIGPYSHPDQDIAPEDDAPHQRPPAAKLLIAEHLRPSLSPCRVDDWLRGL